MSTYIKPQSQVIKALRELVQASQTLQAKFLEKFKQDVVHAMHWHSADVETYARAEVIATEVLKVIPTIPAAEWETRQLAHIQYLYEQLAASITEGRCEDVRKHEANSLLLEAFNSALTGH